MNLLINWILEYPQDKFMILLFIIAWPLANVVNFLTAFVFEGIELTKEELVEEEEKYINLTFFKIIKRLLEAGIIAPYLETLIFQWSIFRLFGLISKDVSNTIAIPVIISAVVFALAHILVYKQWYTILIHLPLGIALSLVFMINDINGTNPVLYTSLFHGIWNIVTIVLLSIVGKLYYSVKKNEER